MQVQGIDHMFKFTFEKTAAEIVDAATNKLRKIRSKIEERVIRIKELREQHGITDPVLIDIQQQMRAQGKRGESERSSYTSNARTNEGTVEEVTIGAGVINSLLTEQDYIDGEKAQAEQLELITRNLRDVYAVTSNGTPYIVKPKLGYDELKYLGF